MRKRIKIDIKNPILIVTSSELTATFFAQMRKDCRYENLTVVHSPSKSLKELVSKTARLKSSGKYKMAWAVFSFSEFSDALPQTVIEMENTYAPRKIGLAYTAHSIMLYWALHFTQLTGEEDANTLNAIITKYVPSFKHSVEYLKGDGSSFHLMLFPKKAIAAANALALNSSYRLKNGIEAINYTKLINSINDYCGEADIVKNQKTVTG